MKPQSLEKIKKGYSDPTWFYDIRGGMFVAPLAYRSSLLKLVKFMERNISDLHLEAAIGSGTFLYSTLLLRKLKKRLAKEEIFGFDYADKMLESAKRKFRKSKNIHIQQADVGDMPYKNDSFESVNIANAFHCFPDADKALKELHRVLKPDGTMAANILLYPRGSTLLRKWSKAVMDWGIRKGILSTPYYMGDIRKRIVDQGFVIVEEEVDGNVYYVLAKKRHSPVL